MKKSKLPKTLNQTPQSITLMTDDGLRDVPVVVKKNARSRNMVMRYQPLQHHVALTLPRYVSIAQGLDFVREKQRWLEKQVCAHARHVPLENGARVPLLGEVYVLRHVGGRGVVRIDGGEILVPGDEMFMARRLREWMKEQLKEHITVMARECAGRLGVRFKKISLRDTRSRWGSCNYSGDLSFSWRLAFAPREVLEYVVCHEVAHLKHLDHSPKFWAAVALLMPEYEPPREWLRVKGATLYAYG